MDVFFVISGYLITSIIRTDLEQGRFSLLRFYERRARRILPALFLVMAACLPFAWRWMLPQEFKDFSDSLIAALLFVSNVFFWRQTGYFDAASELKPLQHTWSLSVEEQFYVVFPLTMWLLWTIGRRWVAPFLILAAIMSLALADYASWRHPEFNFYFALTRAWELLAGSLCAFAGPRHPTRSANYLAAAGLAGVLGSLFLFSPETRLPSVLGLLPVGGACLIIVYGVKGTWVARLLSMRGPVFIGLISYSLYLWHQPIFAFARVRSLTPPDAGLMAALCLLSLALAYLSWRFVEKPFRFGFRLPQEKRLLVGAAATASALLLGFGVMGHVTSGLPSRLPEQALAFVASADDRLFARPSCKPAAPPLTGCVYGSGKPVVALLGDSHGQALSASLGAALLEAGVGTADFSSFGCLPSRGLESVRFPRRINECKAVNGRIDQVASDESIQTVVIAARWAYWTETVPFQNGRGVTESGDQAHEVVLNGRRLAVPGEISSRAIAEDVVATIRSLLSANKRVVLVYPVPEHGWEVPLVLARASMLGLELERPLAVGVDLFRSRNARITEWLDGIGEHANLIRVRPESLFCENGRCLAELDGKSLYFDNNHLTHSLGAQMLTQEILRRMRQAQWLP